MITNLSKITTDPMNSVTKDDALVTGVPDVDDLKKSTCRRRGVLAKKKKACKSKKADRNISKQIKRKYTEE